MKNILIILSITLLLMSLACQSETRLGHSEEYTNRYEDTEETTEPEETAESEPAEQGKANIEDGSAEDVIAHVKERIANETDCGFLLEADSWTAEYMTGFGTYWLVSSGVAHRYEHVDPVSNGIYEWKYYPGSHRVTTLSGQDDCYLKGK